MSKYIDNADMEKFISLSREIEEMNAARHELEMNRKEIMMENLPALINKGIVTININKRKLFRFF